jgi:osmoprotectant transport system permease protein
MPPDAIGALRRLEGTLDEKRMIHLNMEAERTKNYTVAANLYFEDGESSANSVGESFPHKLARWTLRHLELAGFSLLLSVIIGIPLGIVASRGGVTGQGILGFASILQTIPSLWPCWHCLSHFPFRDQRSYGNHRPVPLWIIADRPNTASGLQDIPRSLRESAIALGLSPFTRLWRFIQWVCARPFGIKTSAVINIGTATLKALIGAGVRRAI